MPTSSPFFRARPSCVSASIWNERGADPAWTIQLRNAMDNAGYLQTRIVSADSGWGDVVPGMVSNPAYAAAVDVSNKGEKMPVLFLVRLSVPLPPSLTLLLSLSSYSFSYPRLL